MRLEDFTQEEMEVARENIETFLKTTKGGLAVILWIDQNQDGCLNQVRYGIAENTKKDVGAITAARASYRTLEGLKSFLSPPKENQDG